jgi:hypothetical protein
MFKKIALLIAVSVYTGAAVFAVTVEDNVQYEGSAHFKITTTNATYYYDKAGGGLARLIDKSNNDWIGFHMTPTNYPPSAAGYSRGIPNYQNGPGHPGFEACQSTIASQNADSVVIKTTSTNDGGWEFYWTFTNQYAYNYTKTMPVAYWWIYEGPIGGRYKPTEQYWGAGKVGGASKYSTTATDFNAHASVDENQQWYYYGDNTQTRIMFMGLKSASYTNKSTMSYMGTANPNGLTTSDGMLVTGFGRAGFDGVKGISGGNKTFYLGFYEKKVTGQNTTHDSARVYIEKVIAGVPSTGIEHPATRTQTVHGFKARYLGNNRFMLEGITADKAEIFDLSGRQIFLKPTDGRGVFLAGSPIKAGIYLVKAAKTDKNSAGIVLVK